MITRYDKNKNRKQQQKIKIFENNFCFGVRKSFCSWGKKNKTQNVWIKTK